PGAVRAAHDRRLVALAGLDRRRYPALASRACPRRPIRTRALSQAEVAAVFRLDVSLREKTYWRLLYESAARSSI
ncbi:MAG TPA: hypothetical protein VIK45_09295, partial [Candidatus Dormibacteraeota bacterium]